MSASVGIVSLSRRVEVLESASPTRDDALALWIELPWKVWGDLALRAQAVEDYRRINRVPAHVRICAGFDYAEFLKRQPDYYLHARLRRQPADRRRRLWARMGFAESELERLEAEWIASGKLKPDGSPL